MTSAETSPTDLFADEPVRSYDAATAPRGLVPYLGASLRLPRTAWQHRELVQNFFRRELSGRFKGSILGVWWALLQPIFLFFVYYFVFGVLFGRGETVKGGQVVIEAFAVWIFSGILTFSAVVEATSGSAQVVLGNGNLVKKVMFPSELLLLSPSLTALAIQLVGTVVVLFPMGLILGGIHLGPQALLLPVSWLIQLLLMVGIGALLASTNVFIRDVSHLWRMFAMGWFFLTPNFWTPDTIIARLGESTHLAMNIVNPMHSVQLMNRQILGIGDPSLFPTSLGFNLAVAAAWSVLLFVLGTAVFSSLQRKFSDHV